MFGSSSRTMTRTGTAGHLYRGVSRPVPLGWPGHERDTSRCVPHVPPAGDRFAARLALLAPAASAWRVAP
jgi:hypothetical protein